MFGSIKLHGAKPNYQTKKAEDKKAETQPKEKETKKADDDFFFDPEMLKAMMDIRPPQYRDFEKQTTELYNQTFDKVMEQNPITKELNIAKPTLLFDGTNHDGAIASYSFPTNTIKLSNKARGDFYSIYATGKNNKKNYLGIFDENTFGKILAKHPFGTIKYDKLSPEEKEIFLSTVMAHELRHSVQSHLRASTEGSMENVKAFLEKRYQSVKKAEEKTKELEEKFGTSYSLQAKLKEANEEIERWNYSMNYKPKKVLPKNTMLKFSMDKADNKYWSVNKHFIELESSPDSSTKENRDKYKANPLEIDAYHYQQEFLMDAINNRNITGLNADVLGSMFTDAGLNYLEGLNLMEQFGYSPLIEKSA